MKKISILAVCALFGMNVMAQDAKVAPKKEAAKKECPAKKAEKKAKKDSVKAAKKAAKAEKKASK